MEFTNKTTTSLATTSGGLRAGAKRMEEWKQGGKEIRETVGEERR